MVSFIYRTQTRTAATTSMLMILRNYLNNTEHSTVFVLLKVKVEMKKNRKRFQTGNFSGVAGRDRAWEQRRLFTASCKFLRHYF